jgi:hypothetical protein
VNDNNELFEEIERLRLCRAHALILAAAILNTTHFNGYHIEEKLRKNLDGAAGMAGEFVLKFGGEKTCVIWHHLC